MKTPIELARTLAALRHISLENQELFGKIDEEEYHVGALLGNAAYIEKQAKDLVKTEALVQADHDPAYSAHARSDIARILAISLRQCLLHDFDFIEVLTEGVEYETAVVIDIQEGRRRAASHAGLNEKSADELREMQLPLPEVDR